MKTETAEAREHIFEEMNATTKRPTGRRLFFLASCKEEAEQKMRFHLGGTDAPFSVMDWPTGERTYYYHWGSRAI